MYLSTEKLQASKKLLDCIKQVTKRWETELQKYKDQNDAFGSFKYNTKWENANTTVAVLFTSMKTVICTSKLYSKYTCIHIC